MTRHIERKFQAQHGIAIHFDVTAVNRLMEKVLSENTDVEALLEALLKNYEHGLKLIREKTGRRSFTFPREAVEHPQQYLNDLIKESYQQGA
jgi:hypothetical protein